MNRKVGAVALLFLLLLVPLGQVNANSGGRFNSSNGCGCHGGSGGVTPVLSGLPSTYAALTTYSLTVGMSTSPGTGGFNLDVNRGTLSNGDTNTQVASNGRQATHDYSPGTSTWTMDWTAPASGSGSVLFKLAVLSGNGNGGTSGDDYDTYSITLSEEVSTNNDPVASDVLLTPIDADTTDALTLTYTYSDDDGDPESGTTIAWYRNGAVQPGHTTNVLPSSATNKGEAWHAVVTPSDGIDDGTPVSSPTVTVANRAPDVLNLAVSDEAPDTNDDVTFTYQTSDVDGDGITSTDVRWMLDGVQVNSLDDAMTLPAVATRVGDVWTVQVRASDGADLSEWAESPAITVGSDNQGPVITDLTISPANPTTQHDLSVSWTATDPEGDDVVETVLIWSLDGNHVPEADGLNPLPASFTVRGEAWTVAVQANDGNAWGVAVEAIVSIENAAPDVSVSLVSPTFTALDDLVMVLNASDADGDTTTLESVRWYLNDGLQSAHTTDTLPAAALTRGDAWYAVVTVADGLTQTEATSPTVVVVNAPPQVSITWPEAPTALDDLVPSITIDDADGDLVEVGTTWYKNGFRDAGLTNATMVSSERLAPEQTWRLIVVADDGKATSGEVESLTTLVNLPPTALIEQVSSNVWFNETTVLSAVASTDPDGTLSRFEWSWDGGTSTGETLALVLKAPTDVTLTVIDEHGATNETTVSLSLKIGPSIRDLEVFTDDRGDVRLTWRWTGDAVAYNILRDGVIIATTDVGSYEDQPPMSGTAHYTVQPFNDERTFIGGSDTISATLTDVVVEEPGPATGLGYALGGLIVLALLVLPVLSRRGGESS